MPETQYFKENDDQEKEVADCFQPTLADINTSREAFFAGAYTCYSLGEVLWDADRAPLVGTVPKDIFISSFFKFFQLFERPGTFEYYLDVFRAIWGETVEVEFVIPGPGKLNINVVALEKETTNLLFRRVVDDVYVYYDALTEGGDNITVDVPRGIKSQSEAERILKELSPAGVYALIDLEFA